MKLISWNCNGINSVDSKGALKEVFDLNPDILCLQEVKTSKNLEKYFNKDYNCYFNPSTETARSGVAIFSKQKAIKVKTGIDIEKFDREGRIQIAEFENFFLFNVYFPSSARKERIPFKFEFFNSLTDYIQNNEFSKPIIICGDFNRIASEMDAKSSDSIGENGAFSPEEVEWFESFLDSGFIDSFRFKNPEKQLFSWWPFNGNGYSSDNGYRLDYFLVEDSLKGKILDADILTSQEGSDHAPVLLELDFDVRPSSGKENFISNEKIVRLI